MLKTDGSPRWRIMRYIYPCTLAVCLIVIVCQQLYLINYEIRLALAQDQVEIFHDMVRRTKPGSQLSSESYSEAVTNYYPSGTKQVRGSQIDRLVESCRRFAIEEIVRIGSGEAKDPDR
jgi:hypothetical protein